jgi:hypothetical protein
MLVREVYDRLKGKVDPEVIKVIVLLAEDNKKNKQMMLSLATQFNRLLDMFNALTDTSGMIKDEVMRMRKVLGIHEDLVTNTDEPSDELASRGVTVNSEKITDD